MAGAPPAELDLDERLVAQLIRDQFPEFARLDLSAPLNGWDNAMFRLGPELVVRLPRRLLAAPLIENEQRWLPVLAPRLSVAVPEPVRVGQPTSYYPWSWSIVPWGRGAPLSATSVHARGAAVEGIVQFLTELHTPAPADAPANPVRGVPLETRDAVLRGRLAGGLVPRAHELLARWDTLSTRPGWPHPPVWLHGDLHPANLLTLDGRLSAVIDFGDITSGDPATDLSMAWLTFDAADRARLLAAVGDHGDPFLFARAEAWAILIATAFATFSDDNPAMAAIGDHAIRQLLGEA
ncbi:MAG: aminoglycoside phosphotransferase family protein [Rhodoglobus sp.]